MTITFGVKLDIHLIGVVGLHKLISIPISKYLATHVKKTCQHVGVSVVAVYRDLNVCLLKNNVLYGCECLWILLALNLVM